MAKTKPDEPTEEEQLETYMREREEDVKREVARERLILEISGLNADLDVATEAGDDTRAREIAKQIAKLSQQLGKL